MTYESKTTMLMREQLRQWFDSLTGLTAYNIVGVLDDLAAAETEVERLREYAAMLREALLTASALGFDDEGLCYGCGPGEPAPIDRGAEREHGDGCPYQLIEQALADTAVILVPRQ